MNGRFKAGAWVGRLQRARCSAGLFLLNTGLAFLVANSALWGLYQARDALSGERLELGRMVAAHGIEAVAAAYPGWPRSDLLTLLRETEGGFDVEYEPLTSFRPRATRGRFLNVSSDGFRAVRNQGPWPPDPSSCGIFVFGGSTTFGIGVPDGQTIPSLLGERLARVTAQPVHVYNFGRPGYLAVQERLLLEGLLASGAKPRLTVFIDGLNEFYVWPRPVTADLMRRALASTGGEPPLALAADWLGGLPVGRAAHAVARRIRTPDGPADWASGRHGAGRTVSEWLANKRLIEAVAAEFHTEALLVWQPVPWYRYDLAHHRFADSARRMRPPQIEVGYDLVDRWRSTHEADHRFLWLADLQADRRENLYATDTHYTAAFAEEIAAQIARHIEMAGLLECGQLAR